MHQLSMDELNKITVGVIGAAIEVHKHLGLDLLVNDSVIVEVKSVSDLAPIHDTQLLSYLKVAGGKIGLLLNFNVKILKHGGIKRLAH